MKIGVLTLIDTFYPSGAENIAVNIALKLNESERYSPVVCSTRDGGELETRLRNNNIEHFILGRNHSYEINKFYPLKQIIRDKNIKIIHAHKIGSNLWGSLIGQVAGIPTISHFHADHKSLEGFGPLVVAKIINTLSNKIISISEFERQRLIGEEGIDPLKTVTIYNGIDSGIYRTTPNLELKEQLGIKQGAPVVGCVAAFREQKNHELLMRAARDVIAENRDVNFVLVGDGVTRKKIEHMAAVLKIEKSCIFTGLRNDIPDLVSVFDVCVLSSHWEGMPLCILEYMASSKPVVCNDVSGLSELVENNVSGFLTPPDDHIAFAEKVNLLLSDRELALSMGRNGLSRVRDEFSEAAMMDRIEKLYDETLHDNF